MRRSSAGADSGGRDTVLGRLRLAGLLPRKALGQHFLHDPRILGEIADAARPERGETVVEVGTGPGTLTRLLASRVERVLTVEVDPRMLDFAREELAGVEGVRFLRADALDGRGGLSAPLRAEVEALGPFKVISNLPFAIASPLIVAFLSSGLPLQLQVVTVQAEVAARLRASPGTRQYGPLTVLVAFWAVVERVRGLPAGAFWPPPKVASEVVRITPRAEPLARPDLYRPYRSWVHRLLSQRRKQVGGLLRDALGEGPSREALAALGVVPGARPDTLRPEAFVTLAAKFPSFEFDSPVQHA